jgi:hypothetical protein
VLWRVSELAMVFLGSVSLSPVTSGRCCWLLYKYVTVILDYHTIKWTVMREAHQCGKLAITCQFLADP